MQAFELEIIQQALAILDSHLKTKGEAMQSPGEVASYLRLQLEQEQCEVFAVLFLDTQHRLLQFVRMFTGTIDQATVYPREVVKAGLALNASAAIICLPITYQCSDIPLSLLSPHFAAICKCHRNDAHCGDKTPGFVTAAKGFVYRSRW